MKDKLLSVSESIAWLESNGYGPRTRQAMHDAARRGIVKAAKKVEIGARDYRFFSTADLSTYANRRRVKALQNKQNNA